MPPKEQSATATAAAGVEESTPLTAATTTDAHKAHFALDSSPASLSSSSSKKKKPTDWFHLSKRPLVVAAAFVVLALVLIFEQRYSRRDDGGGGDSSSSTSVRGGSYNDGPYELVERQVGESFLHHYEFYEGPDSLGSAGYNTYLGKEEALDANLFNVTTERRRSTSVSEAAAAEASGDHRETTKEEEEEQTFVYLQSRPTSEGPRDSVRLEGINRYDSGLFVLDAQHMPTGCGVWPAFWLTDEDSWPYDGEIDIVEGVNRQSVVKTALHTSDRCSMYGHVPPYVKTGIWDRASGIPNTWTGIPDDQTAVDADNCWEMAPHQWFNQGCVLIHPDDGTLGQPFNDGGGGVFALEWDPANGYIKSWAFPRSSQEGSIPDNLRDAMRTSGTDSTVKPDPETWGLPYAYFAIGPKSGCSNDHFKNMRLVINIAFCGAVSGNRFGGDCPEEAAVYDANGDPVWSCNNYVKSNPKEIQDEAYWKIRGVYVYERGSSSDGGD